MSKLKIILFFALSLSFSPAHASDLSELYKQALLKGNEKELNYLPSVQVRCGLEHETVTNLIDGILVRARIKPLLLFSHEIVSPIYMSVALKCNPQGDAFMAVFLDVGFAEFAPAIQYSGGRFTRLGIVDQTDKAELIGAIRNGVEKVITDYISVHSNF